MDRQVDASIRSLLLLVPLLPLPLVATAVLLLCATLTTPDCWCQVRHVVKTPPHVVQVLVFLWAKPSTVRALYVYLGSGSGVSDACTKATNLGQWRDGGVGGKGES
eukprot:COSAG01_NODE_238_length_20679_cov_140.041399_11_plen_106_part_00